MKVIQEFREFAMRGSVIDMGIGVIIGTAFGKIVDSLVSDIIMPPIGLLMGKVDFSNLYINLTETDYRSLAEAKEVGAATINYGMFLNSILHFGIVAFATFITIRQINKIRRTPGASITSQQCSYCFTNIPKEAKRCPNCTTILDETVLTNTKTLKQPKITFKAS
ncbi:large-conductance mechanosensitive channel protein MscL [Cytobacillus sp. S13-E01]|uniref:large-conductance mechanosensitive channel protein MscL n=1 Tax=Cytobacillus sp. S13-E01 TaxID=3031326 RepID=UPI0023D8C7B4|nr:large-conductance mechanosensitive channel protein MscL [Cytobacillus sp. S13-E01]MDF0727685.1 large-conductance mechanosensitive channel protein MscL [Cytobacillus sp. S13-E01]